MNQLINDLLNTISFINNNLKNKVFKESEIEEEMSNYKDFLELQNKLKEILQKIKKIDLQNESDCCDKLVDLYVVTSQMAWFFENLNDVIKQIIKAYPVSRQFIEDNS